MSQTAPTTITPLGTPPSTASPANFDTLADAFLGSLPTMVTQQNSNNTIAYNNAVDCFNNAVIAAAAAVRVLMLEHQVGVFAQLFKDARGLLDSLGRPLNHQVSQNIQWVQAVRVTDQRGDALGQLPRQRCDGSLVIHDEAGGTWWKGGGISLRTSPSLQTDAPCGE